MSCCRASLALKAIHQEHFIKLLKAFFSNRPVYSSLCKVSIFSLEQKERKEVKKI